MSRVTDIIIAFLFGVLTLQWTLANFLWININSRYDHLHEAEASSLIRFDRSPGYQGAAAGNRLGVHDGAGANDIAAVMASSQLATEFQQITASLFSSAPDAVTAGAGLMRRDHFIFHAISLSQPSAGEHLTLCSHTDVSNMELLHMQASRFKGSLIHILLPGCEPVSQLVARPSRSCSSPWPLSERAA